ncbi:MAG: hypothetical protein PHS53_04745 [Candidatus Pacebacteria bacterium]|nr:hypothetical protein [Candidatus Paceibacterota bacterium]MDD5357426.1 hypothetical protein [Candidatus Paceibacterota bacterium]
MTKESGSQPCHPRWSEYGRRPENVSQLNFQDADVYQRTKRTVSFEEFLGIEEKLYEIDEEMKPLIDGLRASERLTAADMAVTINCRG